MALDAVWIVLGVLLLTSPFLRWWGVRCPTCKCRMRQTGLTHIIPSGAFPTWLCQKCGARFPGNPLVREE